MNRPILIIGSVLIALLLGSLAWWFIKASDATPLPESLTISTPNVATQLKQEMKSLTGAVMVQGLNRTDAAVYLFDSKTGVRSDVLRIHNAAYPRIPKVRVANGALYYINDDNGISRFDVASEQITTIREKNTDPTYNVLDFAVRGSTLVVLYIINSENTSTLSKPCELFVIDLTTNVLVKVLAIPACQEAHGPNYSVQDISEDQRVVTLFENSSEAGYASIARHEIALTDLTNTVVEIVASSGVCTAGTFYNAIECTQSERDKNEAFEAFQKNYQLGYGWSTQCGALSIRKDDKEYYTFYISASGVLNDITDAAYAGCLE